MTSSSKLKTQKDLMPKKEMLGYLASDVINRPLIAMYLWETLPFI